MDDTVGVGEGDRLADAQQQPQPLAQRQPLPHQLVEALARHELHRVEDPPVGQLAHVVHRHDPRVLEAGEDPGLSAQAHRRVRVDGVDTDHLERHVALELAVARPVHDTHAAARHFSHELVARAREVGPLRDVAQAVEGAVARRLHLGSAPKRARASERNSSSLAVISRSFSSTVLRSSWRAQCRWFVTCVTGRASSAARSA